MAEEKQYDGVPELLRPREAARLFGVDETTLRRWARNGAVKVITLPGGTLRYDLEEIKRLMRGE